MENMEFKNRTELREYIKEHTVKNLGMGREGECHLLDNGSVVKYLYGDFDPNFALQFKDFPDSSFIFAKAGAFVDGYVVAQFMEHANGKSLLDEVPTGQEIATLGDHLEVVTDSIELISEKSVLVKDFFGGNIIYDGNVFKIVDTLYYLLLPMSRYRKENFYEIMNRLYACLLNDIMKHRRVNERFSFYGQLDYLTHPKKYLLMLRDYIADITREEVKTLEEASLALRKKN